MIPYVSILDLKCNSVISKGAVGNNCGVLHWKARRDDVGLSDVELLDMGLLE